MTNTLMNYTNRANVENFLGRVFSDITDTQFNAYLLSTEAIINNYTGYNAETTHSGMLCESIVREKSVGKIDNDGNLVIDVAHPPVQFDQYYNPIVSLVEYNFGGIRVPLQLTVNAAVQPLTSFLTLLEVSENRRKIVYPSIYFLPYLPQVTPTAKMNLYNLRDVKFWADVSYLGGFPTIPGDVTQAANLICGNLIMTRDNPIFAQSLRQGSFSIDYFSRTNAGGKGNKAEARAIQLAQQFLDPYVRWTW